MKPSHRYMVLAGLALALIGALPGTVPASPTWVKLIPLTSGPSARHGHSMVLDSVGNRIIVFGGEGANGPTNDVWQLSLDCNPTWTQLSPDSTPPVARTGSSAIIVPGASRRMVIFGGETSDESLLNDSWELSLTGTPTWKRTRSNGQSGNPCARYNHSAVYFNGAHIISEGETVYQGSFSHFYSQSLSSPYAWTLLKGPNNCNLDEPGTGCVPEPRWDHSHIVDTACNRMLVFGGIYEDATNSTAWTSGNGTDWLRRGYAPTGMSRTGHSAVFDPSGRMIVFGGADQTDSNPAVYNSVQALDLTGSCTTTQDHCDGTPALSWSSLGTSTLKPAARYEHRAVFDAVQNRMIVMGGRTLEDSNFDDVWMLQFTDSLPPAAVSNLDYYGYSSGVLTIRWTSPGDDGSTGTACKYEIRYSTTPITDDATFASATLLATAPAPASAGTNQTTTLSGLATGVWWYFAMKTTDERANKSGLSNVFCVKLGSPVYLCEGGEAAGRTVGEGKSFAFAIEHIQPNPSPGEFTIALSLPGGQRARLELLDVSGRRVREMDVPAYTPGRQVVRFAGSEPLRAGYYVVRLTQGDHSVSRPALILK